MTNGNATGRSKAVAIVSGGLDSTTMLYQAVKDPNSEYDIIQSVSFNYGQRHKKELDYAEWNCDALGIPWVLIDLWSSGLTEALSDSGSSLVDSKVDVPEGHYAEETMKATVVPNRNMIMLSIAAGIAVAKGAETIMTGVHAGDHFVYPDCRPRFVMAADAAIKLGNAGFGPFPEVPDSQEVQSAGGIAAPYIWITKGQIAYYALQNGVPLDKTWSCYKGDKIHCGKCGTCVERLEAINWAVHSMFGSNADVAEFDKTEYADTNFWKEAIANA